MTNDLPTFTGTEVSYYFICHKKLWWFAHVHEPDRVKMGIRLETGGCII